MFVSLLFPTHLSPGMIIWYISLYWVWRADGFQFSKPVVLVSGEGVQVLLCPFAVRSSTLVTVRSRHETLRTACPSTRGRRPCSAPRTCTRPLRPWRRNRAGEDVRIPSCALLSVGPKAPSCPKRPLALWPPSVPGRDCARHGRSLDCVPRTAERRVIRKRREPLSTVKLGAHGNERW